MYDNSSSTSIDHEAYPRKPDLDITINIQFKM